MSKIKTALISLSDKHKLAILLKILKKYKIKILSSGGTYKKIKKLGYKSVEISEYTNFPEILDGRVKTLHPKLYAGILSKRGKISHLNQLKKNEFEEIDLVIINFYPFIETMNKTNNQNKIVENIDIGGPSLVRAAAKNFKDVTVITSPDNYKNLENELKKHNGSTSNIFRKKMSEQAFKDTAYYDFQISNYFSNLSEIKFPNKIFISAKKVQDFRYGENPHQEGALYSLQKSNGKINQISGKELSYNNYVDLMSALNISRSLGKNIGTVILKHGNPCGVSINRKKLQSYKFALNCDPVSAFGGIVSCNFKINHKLAAEMNKKFYEIIVGKGFDKEAVKILKQKKNLIIIDSSKITINNKIEFMSKADNLITQTRDNKKFTKKDFKIVSEKKPNRIELENLIFAFNVCRFVKSNAIVLSKNFSTVGIGSGQTSRIDSCKIAIDKMNSNFDNNIKDGIYAASDAFFPFADGIEKLFSAGVTAVVQPSGSIRDKEIIRFANRLGIILLFSKTRHFNH